MIPTVTGSSPQPPHTDSFLTYLRPVKVKLLVTSSSSSTLAYLLDYLNSAYTLERSTSFILSEVCTLQVGFPKVGGKNKKPDTYNFKQQHQIMMCWVSGHAVPPEITRLILQKNLHP